MSLQPLKDDMPVISSHIDELEDALADGHEFHVLPAAEWIAGLLRHQPVRPLPL